MPAKPIVAIIGRPNVGKSTLFNRILKKREAIVDDMPGVTRDRHYEEADWIGYHFILTDTGGLIPTADGGIDLSVREQAELAINEANVILFLTDVEVGVLEEDIAIARQLLQTQKPVVLGVNKVDNDRKELDAYEFYQLGLGDPYFVSAEHGRGVGDLLDGLVACLDRIDMTEEVDETTKIAVVGRPNVGKSSLVNRLAGAEKMIVHDVPGTTRDSIDTRVKYYGKEYTLIDTAGLRKRSRVHERIEYFSNLRTQKAIKQCDVALLLIDATEKVLSQDVKVARMIANERVGVIILVNKWDLVENKDTYTTGEFIKTIRERMPFLDYAPILFISALTGQRITKVYEMVDEVHTQMNRRIQTSEFNDFLQAIVRANHPPASHGKYVKIYYGTQRAVRPPSFVFFSNYPELLPKSYLRYIENKIREQFGFAGAPFRLRFQKRQSE